VSGADRRGPQRREGERRAASSSRTLVTTGASIEDHVPARPAADPAPAASFAAQMIGQPGQKRGIKGGPPVMDAARSAYLETEYSGAKERRPRAGKATRTDV
jgi:hypothetical protein